MSARVVLLAVVLGVIGWGIIGVAAVALGQEPPATPPAWADGLPTHGDLLRQNGGVDPFASLKAPDGKGCCHGDCEPVAVAVNDGTQWMWVRSKHVWCPLDPTRATHLSPIDSWVACFDHSVTPTAEAVCTAIAKRCMLEPPGT